MSPATVILLSPGKPGDEIFSLFTILRELEKIQNIYDDKATP
jgi:hypothetical protein